MQLDSKGHAVLPAHGRRREQVGDHCADQLDLGTEMQGRGRAAERRRPLADRTDRDLLDLVPIVLPGLEVIRFWRADSCLDPESVELPGGGPPPDQLAPDTGDERLAPSKLAEIRNLVTEPLAVRADGERGAAFEADEAPRRKD